MKYLCLVMAILLLFSSCYSTPHVENQQLMEDGKWRFQIDRDYLKDPVEQEYAINSFVMDLGEASYEVQQYGVNDFYVTVPGSQPVVNLPEVRHFHKGKTAAAIIIPIACTNLVIGFVAYVVIIASITNSFLNSL